MAVSMTTPNTVLGVLLPKQGSARLVANVVTVVLGSLVLAAAANLKVPLPPVPINLTTLAVAILAAGFGWRIGVATIALYIAEGLSGLPFFANGGGWGYVLSPSFGFIVGYLPMVGGTDGREAYVAADYNAEMIEQVERFKRVRDVALYIGDESDIVPDAFGPELPLIAEWVGDNFEHNGYIRYFDPSDLGDRRQLRERFGFHDGATGAPILDGAPAYVDCEVRQAVDCGGHTFFIGEVVDTAFQADEDTEVLRMEDTRMSYGG